MTDNPADGGLPVPTPPPSIESLSDPKDREKAREVWSAAHRLMNVLRRWRQWWLELRECCNSKPDCREIDPGLPILWGRVAFQCLHTLYGHRVNGYFDRGVSLHEAVARLPSAPDGSLGGPRYDLNEAGTELVLVGQNPPWYAPQVVRALLGNYFVGPCDWISQLEGGMLALLESLEGYPLATLNSNHQAQESAAEPEDPYIPAQEAARAFGQTLPAISKLCREGKVASRKPTPEQRKGKEKLQVHAASLARYLAEQEKRKEAL